MAIYPLLRLISCNLTAQYLALNGGGNVRDCSKLASLGAPDRETKRRADKRTNGNSAMIRSMNPSRAKNCIYDADQTGLVTQKPL